MRISATTLESYRLWRDEDWMSEADLVASIKRERPATPAMTLGTAFGDVLADPGRYAVPDGLGGVAGYRHGDHFFPADLMASPLALFDRRGLFEVKATAMILPGVTLVAKADQIVGSVILENKATLSLFDADKYLASYQWRVMAEIFRPSAIEYRVFCLAERANGTIDLRSIERLLVYPYPGLGDDVRALVREFVAYVELRGLTPWLADKAEAA